MNGAWLLEGSCGSAFLLWRWMVTGKVGPVEGPSLHSLAAGEGVLMAALDGELGFAPLQSWSWDPPQDSQGTSLLLPLPFSPPSWALALLDREESGLDTCSSEVLASGRDFKHLLSWGPKPSFLQSSPGSSGDPMHCVFCNSLSSTSHICRAANDLHMPTECNVGTGSPGHVIWNWGWGL